PFRVVLSIIVPMRWAHAEANLLWGHYPLVRSESAPARNSRPRHSVLIRDVDIRHAGHAISNDARTHTRPVRSQMLFHTASHGDSRRFSIRIDTIGGIG